MPPAIYCPQQYRQHLTAVYGQYTTADIRAFSNKIIEAIPHRNRVAIHYRNIDNTSTSENYRQYIKTQWPYHYDRPVYEILV